MKKILLSAATMLICAGLIFTSCGKKDKDIEADPDLSSEQDHSTSESDLNTTQAAIDAAYSGNPGEYRIATCGTVTITSDSNTSNGGSGPALANFPNGYRKFTIDFTSSPNCSDTITRTGQIVVYHSGHYATNTLYDSAVFVGFSISGRSIKGYRSRRADAAQSTSLLKVFNVHAVDTITFTDGKTITWDATRVRKDNLTALTATINGSTTGKNRNNESFTSTTTNVVFDFNCTAPRYPVSGTFSFTNVAKGITRSIDYGSGNCDRIATFTSAKGNTFTFIMR